MSKEKRQIEKEDLMAADAYVESRKQIRKNLVEFKKNRRIALGPYATFILKVLKLWWHKFKKCYILKKVVMNN